MNINEFEIMVNEWGQQRVPFLFMVDFEMKKPFAVKLQSINSEEILYALNGKTNCKKVDKVVNTSISTGAVSLEDYKNKFEEVYRHLQQGDSYLTNLTIKTEVTLHASLHDLFYVCEAKYKLLFKNEFLVFSPEIFVQIRDGKIYSYPMKGTINSAIPYADKIILNDKKELAEHITIVDLIRNDLSRIAQDVKVSKFRYLDRIKTNRSELLQVSSEIVGTLQKPYERLGTLIVNLLPAGSVTGAPKAKTMEIIRKAEMEDRGYYTGVFGIFDGHSFDSGVMIRFIEKKNDKYFYRSGGGITTQSVCKTEYQEAIDKIYVPVN